MNDTDLNSEIDRLLAERRPDRYEPHGGDEWLDQIAAEVAHLVPVGAAQAIHAAAVVRRREGDKKKKTNQLLRDIAESGQPPLGWFEHQRLPLAVGKERVALGAARPDDLRQFAAEERRRILADMAARNESCEGAEVLAGWMEKNGWQLGRDIKADGEDG